MLTKLNEGEVLSDAGFKIRMGREHVSYIEPARAAHVDIADSAAGNSVILYPASIQWFPPHESEVLTEKERGLIIARMTAALEILGLVVAIASE